MMKEIKFFSRLICLLLLTGLSSCDLTDLIEEGKTAAGFAERIQGIPLDSEASSSPAIGTPTVTLPNFQCNVTEEEGHFILNIEMTGIYDAENKDWLQLFGTGEETQNIWLEIDGKPKGILVFNSSNNRNDLNSSQLRSGSTQKAMADIVFLVDNSGSMNEEANKVAEEIVDWANTLSSAESQLPLDLQFGCVGYGYNSDNRIYGAIDITDVNSLSNYLNSNGNGVYHTVGYGGSNSTDLQNKAGSYDYSGGENGVLALRFADENFKFRDGALRTYINFTDEPNQPGGSENWSVEYVNPAKHLWNATQGTVHTVYSAGSDTSFVEKPFYEEKPWRLSDYTGGSKMFTSPSFNVNLGDLPVSGALQNISQIRTVADLLMDGKEHTVTITVLDGNVGGVKTVRVNFSNIVTQAKTGKLVFLTHGLSSDKEEFKETVKSLCENQNYKNFGYVTMKGSGSNAYWQGEDLLQNIAGIKQELSKGVNILIKTEFSEGNLSFANQLEEMRKMIGLFIEVFHGNNLDEVVFVGHSMGGLASINYAIQFAGTFKDKKVKIITVDTPYHPNMFARCLWADGTHFIAKMSKQDKGEAHRDLGGIVQKGLIDDYPDLYATEGVNGSALKILKDKWNSLKSNSISLYAIAVSVYDRNEEPNWLMKGDGIVDIDSQLGYEWNNVYFEFPVNGKGKGNWGAGSFYDALNQGNDGRFDIFNDPAPFFHTETPDRIEVITQIKKWIEYTGGSGTVTGRGQITHISE
jgi:pimeloyl-ACP methyl ester carboxylesterase